MEDKPLIIAGKTYQSRLLVGTGKYKDMAETKAAITASGAEIITVAVRRLNAEQQQQMMDVLPPSQWEGTKSTETILGEGNTLSKEQLERVRELRQKQTNAEQLLWGLIRGKVMGVKFRRQHPIDPYIVDFYCNSANLVIELDGSQHAEDTVKLYDEKRTRFLEENGYRVIRFWNNDVLNKTDAVLEKIYQELSPPPKSKISSPPSGRGYTYLPNTAGCFDAESAIRTLRLAREASGEKLVKLEVLGDEKTLYPNVVETLKSAKILVDEGFDVMAYTNDDLIVAKELEKIGCVAVMPLGAPIGSGLGIQNPLNIKLIVEALSVPVLVDAGVGTASDATLAMELGCDGVLMNTALAEAQNPVQMAEAMKHAVIAGRKAYLAGRMPKREYAVPSSPVMDKQAS